MTSPTRPRFSGWRRWLAGRTLRTRLIAGLLLLFTACSAGIGVATSLAVHRNLLNRLDHQLIDSGNRFASSQGNPTAADGPPAPPSAATLDIQGQTVGTFLARLQNGRIVQAAVIRDSSGQVSLTDLTLSAADAAVLQSLPATGHPGTRHLSALGDYRLVARTGTDGDTHVTGLSLRDVTSTVRSIELLEILIFTAALAVSALAAAGWIRLSLGPLRRMTTTAAEVATLPLATGEVTLHQRVADNDPRTEVGQLGTVFNQMLGHVETALTQRQASEARVRAFVADASHELRTPLAGIRSHTELAQRHPDPLPPAVRHALNRVETETDRMSRLVDDLLLLARIDAGQPLTTEPVDLTRLVIETTNDARTAAPTHRWRLDLPAEPVTIRGDEQRLHQALTNLLANASTHTPAGTTVTVTLHNHDPAAPVHLSVTDNGPGIPTDLQATVFQRFVRGDNSRSRNAGSTGLGLAIVHAVIHAHHGALTLTSHPGHTTIDVTLPDQPTPPATTTPNGNQ
jgi:two-component system, OmpR family, sensor kinase